MTMPLKATAKLSMITFASLRVTWFSGGAEDSRSSKAVLAPDGSITRCAREGTTPPLRYQVTSERWNMVKRRGPMPPLPLSLFPRSISVVYRDRPFIPATTSKDARNPRFSHEESYGEEVSGIASLPGTPRTVCWGFWGSRFIKPCQPQCGSQRAAH